MFMMQNTLEALNFYSQSSQTPLTDCFTFTGSSEGNLKQRSTLQKLFLYNKCTTKILITLIQKLQYEL